MIRVLYLRRQKVGGIATYTELLRHGLEAEGIDVVVDDAEFIPNETGWAVDRGVSKVLKEAVKGFDLIHAFGYRAAWACSEAFYFKRPWVYTAYDMPKTTVSQLIDRLNAARTGIVPSRAVKNKLDEVDALNLELITPCVWVPSDLPSKEQARAALGISELSPMVLAMGPFGKDRGFGPVIGAFERLRLEIPDATVAVIGEGLDLETGEGILRVEREDDRWLWMQAADVVVVPYERAGFSMVAGEAMMLGKSVLLRNAGGLPEMGSENVSIELFENDDEILFLLLEILNSPIHREALGESAKIWAEEKFSIEKCAKAHAKLYRDLLTR